MEKQIVEQIEKLIADMRSDETMGEFRKTSYVKGYQSALSDVERIILLAKSLYAQAKKGGV